MLVAAGVVTGFALGPGRKVVPSVNLSQESIDELLARREQLAAAVPQRSEVASGAMRMLTGLALSGISILLRKSLESYFKAPPQSEKSDIEKSFGSY